MLENELEINEDTWNMALKQYHQNGMSKKASSYRNGIRLQLN